MDQLPAPVFVAAFADPEQLRLASRGELTGNQAEPGGEIAPAVEAFRPADGGDKSGCDDRADAGDSRAPELNPVENVWQFLRSNWLSNLVFDTYDEIIDAVCDAWRNLKADPETITSIGTRKWAHIGHSP